MKLPGKKSHILESFFSKCKYLCGTNNKINKSSFQLIVTKSWLKGSE